MTGPMVRADEIRWEPFTGVDLLLLDDAQLFDYAVQQQDDLRILAKLVTQLVRTIAELRRENAGPQRGVA